MTGLYPITIRCCIPKVRIYKVDMRYALLIVVALLLNACASGPPVRSETYSVSDKASIPYETAWQNAIHILTARGFAIENSNMKGGVISLQERPVKLNEPQADCGEYHGISYLNDYRTTLYMTLFIDFDKVSDMTTAVRINSVLKATFVAGLGAEPREWTCYSSGYFEKKLLSQIID
jgi:hypothetical protein